MRSTDNPASKSLASRNLVFISVWLFEPCGRCNCLFTLIHSLHSTPLQTWISEEEFCIARIPL